MSGWNGGRSQAVLWYACSRISVSPDPQGRDGLKREHNPHGQSGRRINHVGTLANRLAAGRGSRAGGAVRGGICPGDSARRGGPPSCGPVPQPAGAGLDCPGDAARGGRRPGRCRSKTWTWPSGSGHRLIRWPRLGSAWPTGSPRRFASTWMPASRSGRWSGSKSWRGTRSAVRRCGGPARSPRPGRSALAEGRRGEFGRAQEQLDRAERLAAGAGAIAAQQAVAAAKTELENRQKGGRPQGRGALRGALGREVAADPLGGRGRAGQRARAPGGAAGAVAGLAADCGDRSRTAAQWPQRGARAAQAAAMVEPGRSPSANRPSLAHARSPRGSSG